MDEVDSQCNGVKRDGQRCRAIIMHGSGYCFFHNPTTKELRKKAQQSGGEANRVDFRDDVADVALRSSKDVAAFLANIINDVRKGEVSPKIASTVGYLSGLIMKALDTSDLEDRLGRLESALRTREAEQSFFDPNEDEELADEES